MKLSVSDKAADNTDSAAAAEENTRLIHVPVCRVLVSQHALTVQVEVYEGVESVLLPCKVSFVLEDTTVMWDRYDLSPKNVHRWFEGRDELEDQNPRYRGRTATDGAEPGDLSLTLRTPQVSDSGNYTCTIRKLRDELRLRDVELNVKGQEQTPAQLLNKEQVLV